MRLIWCLVGVGVGISIGRNAEPMSTPVLLAAGLGLALVAAIGVLAARRDSASAVATAVAKAEATASAHLEAALAAQASSLSVAHGGSVVIGGEWAQEGPGREAGESRGRHALRAPRDVPALSGESVGTIPESLGAPVARLDTA